MATPRKTLNVIDRKHDATASLATDAVLAR